MTETITAPRAGAGGTELTRFNALRHGVLSRYTVLPWEDADEYEAVLAALAAEHAPQGPTEEHLVEELAGVVWRKRRLRQAEAAAHRRGLDAALAADRGTARAALAHLGAGGEAGRALRASEDETAADLAAAEADWAAARRALGLLGSDRKRAYEAALAALPEGTRRLWDGLATDPAAFGLGLSFLADGGPASEDTYTADVAGLRRFLEGRLLPELSTRREAIPNRALIREQAYGEAAGHGSLEHLARYEVHLDRKLERTLTMLLRLQELRRAGGRG